MKKEVLLIVTHEIFLELLSEEKKTEYRNFTEFYISRFCNLAKDGEIESTKDLETLKFALGYSKDRPELIIEVKDIHIDYDPDEAGNAPEFLTTDNCEFVIDLGEIKEKKNCESIIV